MSFDTEPSPSPPALHRDWFFPAAPYLPTARTAPLRRPPTFPSTSRAAPKSFSRGERRFPAATEVPPPPPLRRREVRPAGVRRKVCFDSPRGEKGGKVGVAVAEKVEKTVGLTGRRVRLRWVIATSFAVIATCFISLLHKNFSLHNQVIDLQALGEHGVICLEDIIHEISTVGPHFKEVSSFLWPFKLKTPERGLKMNKKHYKDGGHVGNRDDKINELIEKLN